MPTQKKPDKQKFKPQKKKIHGKEKTLVVNGGLKKISIFQIRILLRSVVSL